MVRLSPDEDIHMEENISLSRLLIWVIIDKLQIHSKGITFMDMCILSRRYTNKSIPAYLALDWLLENEVISSSGAILPVYSLI